MTREKNTIIVELKNHRYNKLYIEVEDPETAMELLNIK
jgi:Holliday junction resolvase